MATLVRRVTWPVCSFGKKTETNILGMWKCQYLLFLSFWIFFLFCLKDTQNVLVVLTSMAMRKWQEMSCLHACLKSQNIQKPIYSSPGASLWGPLKELWETVDGAVLRKQPESVHLLDLQLKKHKPHFLSLFKNPVRWDENNTISTSYTCFLHM